MVKVKICGITNLEDAQAAQSLGASALGFVFYPKSPRYILPQAAQKIISQLNKKIKKIGVFVNADLASVKKIARLCGLDILQFHGDETPDFIRKVKGYKIIKAFKGLKIAKPFFLSGGLNPENIVSAIKAARPDWVDVSSGVEAKPGIKDKELLRDFIHKARSL